MRVAIGVAMLLLSVGAAVAQSPRLRPPPGVEMVVPAPGANPNLRVNPNRNQYQAAPSYCWLDVRMYQTLRHGPVDYCRQKLKYSPGKLECFQITDQVCAVLLPDGTWTDTRAAVARQVFACPRAPEPPVCRRLDFS